MSAKGGILLMGIKIFWWDIVFFIAVAFEFMFI